MTRCRRFYIIIAIYSVRSTEPPLLLYLNLILAHGLIALAGERREWREEVVGRTQAGGPKLAEEGVVGGY